MLEGWLIDKAEFQRVCGVSQLFFKRDSRGNIVLLLAKVTDDMLIAGSTADVGAFIDHIGKRFPISKAIVNDDIKLNGCDISQDNNDTIKRSKNVYVRNIKYIVQPERKKNQLEKATNKERDAFRSMAGEFVWAG